MPRIKTLALEHAHKIAAGQVVERPASIVKELVENSIDAGATKIIVTIEDGGKKLIRVQDNGCGMDQEDAHACFGKHATSKISSFEDLINLTTFGFRGEALPSIAAVSNVVLITREHDAPHATKIEIAESKLLKQSAVAAPAGTDITITSLFETIPARKKFLKKKETEYGHIESLFQAFCMHHTDIHFVLESDDREIFNCPRASSLIDRCIQLSDYTIGKQLLEVKAQRDIPAISITGVISDYTQYRYDRSEMFFFVNGRWVKNFNLSKALIKGYGNTLGQGKYPRCAIAITLDTTLVDINIHPRKEEVLFMHPRMIEELIEQAVVQALEKKLSTYIQKPFIRQQQETTAPITPFDFDSWFSHTTAEPLHNPPLPPISTSSREEKPLTTAETQRNPSINHQVPIQQNRTILQKTHEYTIIGQLHKTYILLEQPDGLFVIDQHAAHERILYEQFKNRNAEINRITLLFPVTLELSRNDVAHLEQQKELFEEHGITLEHTGINTLSITTTPLQLKNINLQEFIRECIGYSKEHEALDPHTLKEKMHEYLHAQMACKAAVKAGDVLDMQQMKHLVETLYTIENRFACPHGRPTGWLLSTKTFEKEFHRDYRP